MSIRWDSHACFPINKDTSLDGLESYRDAGLNFISINIGMDYNPLETILQVVARFRQLIQERDDAVLVGSIADIEKARERNKVAIAFDLEGSVMFQDNLHLISLFYDLGVRQTLLAYNKDNSMSGGCMGSGAGLSDLGRLAVREMNRVGMVVDVSHMSLKSSLEAIEVSEKPPVFSHSNAKALCDHPRNITDEQIRACAAKDGVIGVNGIGSFLNPEADTSTERIVEHIDHMVQLVGASHVGIGLDYVVDQQELMDFLASNPDYYKKQGDADSEKLFKYGSPDQFPEIESSLEKRGYSRGDVDAIMGENFLRIAKENWKQ